MRLARITLLLDFIESFYKSPSKKKNNLDILKIKHSSTRFIII